MAFRVPLEVGATITQDHAEIQELRLMDGRTIRSFAARVMREATVEEWKADMTSHGHEDAERLARRLAVLRYRHFYLMSTD